MLTIRFFRVGKKRQPVYKIVVTDKKNAPSKGRFVEEIGFYNPMTKERQVDKEKASYWISKGAQPSDTVHNLLITEKVIEGKKRSKHKLSKKEEPKPEEKIEKKEVVKEKEEEPQKEEVEEKKEEEPQKEEVEKQG